MAGAMSVAILILFVSLASSQGSFGLVSTTTSMKNTTKKNVSPSLPTTLVPTSPTSRTSTSVSKGPNIDPTGKTEVTLTSHSAAFTTESSKSSQPMTPTKASASHTPMQTSGFSSNSTTNTHLTGTSKEPRSSNFSSTLSPNSDFTTGNTSSITAVDGDVKPDLSRSPGLVAVLCIFCICLGLLLIVGIAKLISLRVSTFQRLEDVPMGKMNEESPFAHYPTKQY